jgi:hypothetical protein
VRLKHLESPDTINLITTSSQTAPQIPAPPFCFLIRPDHPVVEPTDRSLPGKKQSRDPQNK